MKTIWNKYLLPLYFTTRWHYAIAGVALLFVIRFFVPWLGMLPFIAMVALAVVVLLDYLLLFTNGQGMHAVRTHAERFSNGDENPVNIYLESRYAFAINILVIDEIPHQFQRRNVLFSANLPPGASKHIVYTLRPVKRGSYHFGNVNVYVQGAIGLLQRRYRFMQPRHVPVYPSYIQMRRYQLMAISNRLSETGVKRVRRLGHSMEFEQIKEYVQGDDYRTVNWKATARKGQLMVNNYTEEKSQQVYCIIDKGRVMKMPFEGMSLLDYAINATLVLSNVALLKQDRAGLLTISEAIGSFLPASKNAAQMQAVLDTLYNQKTRYLETDFEQLYIFLRRNVSQRSLLVLFTNFETVNGMRRQLPYLRQVARHHLLVVVFFENTELGGVLSAPAPNVEDVYTKSVAEQFVLDKRQVAAELQQHGIITILTSPQQLTINALNKYLELKARQVI